MIIFEASVFCARLLYPNRFCPDLIPALICIHFSPFCPKGTPPSEPTEAVKGKEKVLQSCHDKRVTLKTVHFVIQAGSMFFQRYFFPLDGGGGVLIQSIFNDPIPFFSTFTKTDFYVIIKRITTYAETEPTP